MYFGDSDLKEQIIKKIKQPLHLSYTPDDELVEVEVVNEVVFEKITQVDIKLNKFYFCIRMNYYEDQRFFVPFLICEKDEQPSFKPDYVIWWVLSLFLPKVRIRVLDGYDSKADVTTKIKTRMKKVVIVIKQLPIFDVLKIEIMQYTGFV